MKRYKNKKIESVADVIAFSDFLVNELGVNFHPDDSFGQYINIHTKQQSFTEEECEIGDARMEECFGVCEKNGIDVYELMGKALDDWRNRYPEH